METLFTTKIYFWTLGYFFKLWLYWQKIMCALWRRLHFQSCKFCMKPQPKRRQSARWVWPAVHPTLRTVPISLDVLVHTHTHTQLAIHHMLLLSCLDLSVSSANTVPAIGCTGTEHVDKERSSWFCSLYFVLLLFIKSYCFLKLIYWIFRKWRMRSCLLIEAYSLADRRYYARYDCVKTFHKQDHLF